jgi:8-oxo-dGTP pyrophosphatase MutT (NUDIX family)
MAFVGSRQVRQTTCTNCGQVGHHFKTCIEPITSYGIIAFRINRPDWNQAESLARDQTDFTGIPQDDLEFLLIQRRDSIGYVELLRAKYKVHDITYIVQQIEGTTAEERTKLRTKSFHDLWVELWGPMTTAENRQYKQEYDQAKAKFETLKEGIVFQGQIYTLDGLLDSTPVRYTTPEWGFPKGRRNMFESDYSCAVREFCEETGLQSNQFRIFENMKPIRETFIGNNTIHYSHVYYVAWVPRTVPVKLSSENICMSREIGGIGWFSLNDALERLRQNNVEKREVLLRTSLLARNFCPLLVGPVAAVAEQAAHAEGTPQNRNEPRSVWGGRLPSFGFVEESD